MVREIKLVRDRRASYESVAHFYSVLAYPDEKDHIERARFFHTLCRWVIEDRMKRNPKWAGSLRWIRPQHFRLSDKVSQQVMDRGWKKLTQRIIAAIYIFMPILLEDDGVELPWIEGLAAKVNDLSVLGSAALGWSPESFSTFKAKVWKPTKAVVHAVLPWAHWAQIAELENLENPEREFLTDFLTNETALGVVLESAEYIRRRIPSLKKIDIRDDEIIKFTI